MDQACGAEGAPSEVAERRTLGPGPGGRCVLAAFARRTNRVETGSDGMRKRTTAGRSASGAKRHARKPKDDMLRVADRMERAGRAAKSSTPRGSTRVTPASKKPTAPVRAAAGRRKGKADTLELPARTAKSAPSRLGATRREEGRGAEGATVILPQRGPGAAPSRTSPRVVKPAVSGRRYPGVRVR